MTPDPLDDTTASEPAAPPPPPPPPIPPPPPPIPASAPPIPAQPWRGGRVAAGITCVLAPNPSGMTLDGTNTWLLHRPEGREAALVDPGPLDDGHAQAIVAAARRAGVRITLVLLTHGHDDHTESAEHVARLVGAPLSFPGQHQAARRDAGEPLDLPGHDVDGLRIEAIPTPGHTHDSVCFWLPQQRALLTGDTILGRGTTVVTWPDGALAPYLASLARLRELCAREDVEVLLPGHGHPVRPAARALAVIDYYVAHRHERLDQVRAALDAAGVDSVPGPQAPGFGDVVEQVVRTVYADAPREVWPAARQSVRAQLEYLR